jgi:hypothetical protein
MVPSALPALGLSILYLPALYHFQVVITEMHQLVANPQIQVQLVDYAKAACALVPSFADTCKADIDQYAPMFFGMVLAYLQPEQVRCCLLLAACMYYM